MPGLKLHTSNQLEVLAVRLAGSLEAPPRSSALAPEVVVVQSRGMARWVSLELSRINGICMNVEFPFPAAFVEEMLRLFFPEMAGNEAFSADTMAWRIHALLPALAREKEFSLVKQYLADDDGLKLFQLSEKIAGLFDHYMVYRPGMLLEWERDPSQKEWQALLWRELAAGGQPSMHLAAVSELLEERMAVVPRGALLPPRVAMFGICSLPPLYLRVLFALSRHCEVNLFTLNPSQEYFGHDLPAKSKARLLSRSPGRQLELWEEESAAGNPLLTSLGKLNRDFIELRLELDERAGFVTQDLPEEFVEPTGDAMLPVVQRDVLHAVNRGEGEHPRKNVKPADQTLQVHSCHSPMREIEVLYDHLLDLFKQDPELRPRDVIVMTPDIEKYAPFIHSVFAFPEDQRRHIPFSITDRRPRGDSSTVETFLALMALPGSRCTATEIFSVIDRPPVRAKFHFTAEEMVLIRQWIAGSGIRWGIDAGHRAGFELPEVEANTWRAGFRRLLLGVAMTGGRSRTFEGIVPYDEMEGAGAEVLGRFITVAEEIFHVVAGLPEERPLEEWPDVIDAIATRFFPANTSEEVADLRLIQTALDQLRDVARRIGGGGPGPKAAFRAVRHYLTRILDDTEQRGGFLTGGVTFCALKPMRSIPARVICLVGMDDQAFPRRNNPPAFDLMAREPRCGDRSPRDDDRYSFLEAIISARKGFYISYTGRSAADNEEIPPSVVVSELLDYLDRAFVFPEGRDARAFVVRKHRLHAFSPAYFDGKAPRLFSFSEANAAAAKSLQGPPQSLPGFFAEPLPSPGEEARDVELAEIIEFFAHPAKYFVRHRLGIRLGEDEDLLDDSEPFGMCGLERHKLKQELVEGVLEQRPGTADEFIARGMLPLGEIGEARLMSLERTAKEFVLKLEPELRDRPRKEPLLIDLEIGDFSLTGRVESIYGERIVQFRCASLKPKDWLRAWINHLARCAATLAHPLRDSASSRESTAGELLLIAEDETVKFPAVPNAAELLGRMLQIHLSGLQRPLPFFPASAFAYAWAEKFPSAHANTPPLDKARREWIGNNWTENGEQSDAYNAFCFRNEDPLNQEFERLAMEIFEPMLQAAVVMTDSA